MKTSDIRENFLRFFELKGHTRVDSSSLVPLHDPTLLFVNAGMNQFKDVFLGFDTRPYVRATSVQKCVRAGGKHNDLENVGYTARHLTFFEMLGNFSFGDYFKEKAIEFAWEFLTSTDWLGIPKEKLLVTVYAADDEAYFFWHTKIGLPAEKIIRIGDNKGSKYESDNFWQMGDTGPCGPCTEIFYDHGENFFGGPPGSIDEDGDRFIELWNCVFMQYYRDEQGRMHTLPKPSVDTGMGLERIAAVMQQVHSNFAIDIFQALTVAVARTIGVPLKKNIASLNVIADHIRTCSFLIADGVYPDAEGRPYVLRRIIRRAIRHGYALGKTDPFLFQLVSDLVCEMGESYPELVAKKDIIQKTLLKEEEKFSQTLICGMGYLQQYLNEESTMLSGKVAFKLYDTYGFPLDLTVEICKEQAIKVDEDEFKLEMNLQKERARQASQFRLKHRLEYFGPNTEFTGYDSWQTTATVLVLYNDQGESVDVLNPKDSGTIVLDKTPFYAESGGQIGDVGCLYIDQQAVFQVQDTQKIQSDVCGHTGIVVDRTLHLHDKVVAVIDYSVRLDNSRNHSATHLLHQALRKILGVQVEQRGSLITNQRLRFDFTCPCALTENDLMTIESLVNKEIMRNTEISKQLMTYDDAIKIGAMALFGEKYGNEVRVVQMGEFSTELCAGTHVKRTGDIGFFKIVAENGIASGVRRIEAITGQTCVAWVQNQARLMSTILKELKAQTADDLFPKIENILRHNKTLEKSLMTMKSNTLKYAHEDFIKNAQQVNDIALIIAELPFESSVLRESVTTLIRRMDNLVVVLYAVTSDKILVCVGVSKSILHRITAEDLVSYILVPLSGKGGGRSDLAQGSAPYSTQLTEVLNTIAIVLQDK